MEGKLQGEKSDTRQKPLSCYKCKRNIAKVKKSDAFEL